VVFLATGCGTSPPAHFYELASTATPISAAPSSQLAIMVGAVSVPASVDQPQMVVQVAANQVEVEEDDRWIAPLSNSIASAVAGDLASQLGTPKVATAPMANFDPAYTVSIDVQRFESIKDQAALIDAVWTVRRSAGGITRSGRTIARQPVQSPGFDALAAAHSRAIASLSADIAAAIRAEAGTRD
jgi:uncharacterized lipoprotein YmbA